MIHISSAEPKWKEEIPAISKQDQNRIIEEAVGPSPHQRKKTAVS